MFRALPLLVLIIGVVASRRQGNQDDGPPSRPIIDWEQKRRICADLCRSGLGGKPCGEVCLDLMPTGIPLQSSNISIEVKAVAKNTRSGACPILCANLLGNPLCQCQLTTLSETEQRNYRVDFNSICDYYCENQNWVLRGCPMCTNAAAKQNGPQALFKQDGVMLTKMVNVPGIGTTSFQVAAGRKVDWGKWCQEQCEQLNGGSACNCDILPFSLK